MAGGPLLGSPVGSSEKIFRDLISRIGQYSTGGNSVEDIYRERE